MTLLDLSKSELWRACPAYVSLSKGARKSSSPAAAEGVAAHDVLMRSIHGVPPPPGTLLSNGCVVDEDMLEAAADALDYIREKTAGGGWDVFVEYEVYPRFTVHAEAAGRLDVALIKRESHEVVVISYKYGHRHVGVFENSQLIGEAAGFIERLEIVDPALPGGGRFKGWSVTLAVIQPRDFTAPSVREWKLLGHQFMNYARDLSERANRALNETTAYPGPYCARCDALSNCRAAQLVVHEVLDWPLEGEAFELDSKALGTELTILDHGLKIVQARYAALLSEAQRRISEGDIVPGWREKPGRMTKKFSVPPEQVAALGQLYGVNVYRPPTTVTPNQAIDAGIPKAIVDGITTVIPGARKLAPLTAQEIREALSHG